MDEKNLSPLDQLELLVKELEEDDIASLFFRELKNIHEKILYDNEKMKNARDRLRILEEQVSLLLVERNKR